MPWKMIIAYAAGEVNRELPDEAIYLRLGEQDIQSPDV